MQDDSLEGWYTDPYGRHEARWMSQGTPTWQVKDGDVESRDDPVAHEPFKVTPVRIETEGPGDGSDERRADDAQTEGPYDSREARRAAWDVYDQMKVVPCPSIVAWADRTGPAAIGQPGPAARPPGTSVPAEAQIVLVPLPLAHRDGVAVSFLRPTPGIPRGHRT